MDNKQFGVLLTSDTECQVDHLKCIICQEDKKGKPPISLSVGRESLKRAASVKNDVVLKRMKTMEQRGYVDFVYHNTNACYKNYTHHKSVEAAAKSNTCQFSSVSESEKTAGKVEMQQQAMPLRSSCTPRAPPSSEKNPRELRCTVCGSKALRVQGKRIFEKYRISTFERAQMFLDATRFFRDEVYERVPDLEEPGDVLAADIYYHSDCLRKYLLVYERDTKKNKTSRENPVTDQSEVKRQIFSQVVNQIDPLLNHNYGFTVSEIRHLMQEEIGEKPVGFLYNRDIKKMLTDHYGDQIQFAKNSRKYESELFFSSSIEGSELASKIKNLDHIQEAAEQLRRVMLDVDFGLDDRFCDAADLQRSWEETPMPDDWMHFFANLFKIPKAALMKFRLNTMFPKSNDDEEEDEEETVHDESSPHGRNFHSQLYCIFQMISYRLHGGKQKPPLHAMVGQTVYSKTRSRELLTTLNRIGVSTSYQEVRDSRNMLKSYAVSGSKDDIPIPSHFNKEGWAMAALDNSDYKDTSSLSGTNSRHYTASVLYQEAVGDPIYKPLVSSTNISKSDKLSKDMLPCQVVPPHPKPVIRPTIPPDMLLAENTNLLIESQILEALKESRRNEFLITFIRVGLPHSKPSAGQLPPWGGIHALISKRDVPMMRVGFLPVIPRPVTEYCTVRKALQNFKGICHQLNQDVLPVISDEGVFHTVADIIMAEPTEFNDLFPVLGMFHYTKVLLRCAGRYLSGSGAEDALIECEVFGKHILQSVLAGSHYVRSLQGLMIVSEVLSALQWESFWLKTDPMSKDAVVQTALILKDSLNKKSKRASLMHFEALLSKSADLEQQFGDWIKECEEKSDLCAYFGVYQKLVSVIKQIITADREGNWPLHVASVQESMPVLREFDAINYLRYASWYLERIHVLEVTHPNLFRRFSMGLFTVKDHPGSFNAVAPDLKLEQTIQRISQGPGGHVIVGASGNIPIVAEFELLYHEIGAITNLLQQLTNAGVLAHLETNVQHELSGQKGLIFDKNVARMLDFMKARKNPFDITMKIPLHNFVTGAVVDEMVKARLLGALKNGEKGYQAFRNERFVLKTSKLSNTISKVCIPHFSVHYGRRSSNQNDAPVSLKTGTILWKQLAAAQREIHIVKERGKTLEFILGHDLFDTSPLFDGAWCTKPNKSQLIRELEQNLDSEDYAFTPVSSLKTDIILDFMSKIRQYRNLSSFTDFGQVIQRTLSATRKICRADKLHIVFDSYCELSVKEGERIRRAADCGGEIDVITLSESVPIPKQVEKFWASGKNKQALQILARTVSLRDLENVVVSGMVVNEEILEAIAQENLGTAVNVPELSNWQEEADNRLISHIAWSVKRGCKRILVLSNDTDSIALILRYLSEFKCKGLCELWIEIGTSEHRRKVPLHTLHEKIGDALCKVIIKAHILTGNDEVSKIGTKHAALSCNPLMLTNFAETDTLSEMDEEIAEKYLVKTWAGHRSKFQADTFNKLRLLLLLEGKDLHVLPPTTSVIRGHIKRSFFAIRNALMLLNSDNFPLNPEDYGWENQTGTLFPIKYLCPIPPELLVKCRCGKKCDNNMCKCKLHGVCCVEFCHKDKELSCFCTNK